MYHDSYCIFWPLPCHTCREWSLQDQLRQATESVKNMQKLHESAQSQLFELRTQSGLFPSSVTMVIFVTYIWKFIVSWKISFFLHRGGSSCKGGWSQPSDGWSWKGSSTISQSWEGKGSLAICNSSLMLLSSDCITCPTCYNNCYHQSCLNGLTYGLVSTIFLVWGEDIFGIWFELGLNCTKSFLMICILKSQGQINETWIQPFRD